MIERQKILRNRFIRVAERRTTKVIKAVRSLSRCSVRAYYLYDQELVNRIFERLRLELDDAESKFRVNTPIKFMLADKYRDGLDPGR